MKKTVFVSKCSNIKERYNSLFIPLKRCEKKKILEKNCKNLERCALSDFFIFFLNFLFFSHFFKGIDIVKNHTAFVQMSIFCEIFYFHFIKMYVLIFQSTIDFVTDVNNCNITLTDSCLRYSTYSVTIQHSIIVTRIIVHCMQFLYF